MNTNQLKLNIQKHFKLMYGVQLNQAHLDDIDQFYFQVKKNAIKSVIYYRFINMMLSVVLLLIFFVFGGSWTDSWFTLTVLSLFMFYNKIHGFINWYHYKRLKAPKRSSDD